MDKSNQYQELIRAFILQYADLLQSPPPPSIGTSAASNLDIFPVLDDERGQYVLFEMGWRDDEYIRHLPVHIRLHNGKIWIEEDMTEDGIATWLLEQGISHDDIVLAFQPPQMRPLTEFAVA